jgi:hypothetical protein
MNLTTQLAAALLALGDIPYDDAKQMTSEQIVSLYEFDHFPIPRAEGGPDEPWNIVPLLRATHRAKTVLDVARIAKNKRIAARHQAHAARMRDKAAGVEPPPSRWPKRRMRT